MKILVKLESHSLLLDLKICNMKQAKEKTQKKRSYANDRGAPSLLVIEDL